MRIIDIHEYRNNLATGYIGYETVKKVTFLGRYKCDKVLKASKFNTNKIKEWFNAIGIKYTDIKIDGNEIIYYRDNVQLKLSELSSGEAYILYLLASKILEDKVLAIGLFERLGKRLEDVVYKELLNYENLIIVRTNYIIPSKYRQIANY